MQTIHSKIIAKLSPSREEARLVLDKYFNQTGTDNTYEHREVWEKLYRESCEEFTFNNATMEEVQKLVEPIRILFPSQCVSLYSEDNCAFIGNTTWNDQMEMFWEYPTYTKEGNKLATARKSEAKRLGKIASWE